MIPFNYLRNLTILFPIGVAPLPPQCNVVTGRLLVFFVFCDFSVAALCCNFAFGGRGELSTQNEKYC